MQPGDFSDCKSSLGACAHVRTARLHKSTAHTRGLSRPVLPVQPDGRICRECQQENQQQQRGAVPRLGLCSPPGQPAHGCPALPAGHRENIVIPCALQTRSAFEAFERAWSGWWRSLRSTQRGMQRVLASGGRAVCRRCQLPAGAASSAQGPEPEESLCQVLIPSPAEAGCP